MLHEQWRREEGVQHELSKSLHSSEEEEVTVSGQLRLRYSMDLCIVDKIPNALDLLASHIVPCFFSEN